MNHRQLYNNFFVILGIDALILVFAFYAAHLIRFEFAIPDYYYYYFIRMLPFVLIIKMVSFYFFDLYSGMWRYTSIMDILNLIKAATVSSLIIICLILYFTRFFNISRSVFVVDWFLTIFLMSGFRMLFRLYYDKHVSNDNFWKVTTQAIFQPLKKKEPASKKLLIIGAGDCGEKIYREITNNKSLLYNVIGFLDDDSAKLGKKIHGVPVLGNINNIQLIAKKNKADEALIAIPSANTRQMRKILAYCKDSRIKFQTIPGYGELINGKVTVNAIREVAYIDLLGRDPIELDKKQIGSYLKGQSVLVTGAGGSIGSELCRQICRFNPEKLVLYERAESPLYDIELELKQRFSHITFVPLLADIQDSAQIKRAFKSFKPKTVFHAAAYKHVPMLELQPWKAIENNIRGTINLVDLANDYNIERFVFVSTDKAVRPANIMGASKRVAEMLVQSQNGCGLSGTKYMIVRFGNVVGSVGSVVPLFKKQIKKGGPVTVTHPDVTRYFMTIPEACQLILQAGAMGSGGEIFLFDMGTPIKIADMARDLIRLSGFVPEEDIKIEYIGLRPGEKLYEELITSDEGIISTSHEKIMVIKGAECDLTVLNNKINELEISADEQNTKKIKAELQEIVPEYRPV